MLPLAVLALASAGVIAQTASTTAEVGNPFSPAAGHSYRHGVVPTREVHAKMQGWAASNRGFASTAAATGPQTLSYGGGSIISGTPKVYLVVMGTQWGSAGNDGNGNMTLSNDPVGAVPYLQRLFKGLGTGGETWSGTMTQYCDGPQVAMGATSCPSSAPHVGYPTGGPFAGIWYDNSNAAPSAASEAQLAQEAVNAAAHFGNTSSTSNRYVQYVILSPTGTYPDGFNTPSGGFCAWHTSTGSSYGNLAYTNMPYVADMGSSCGQGMVNGSSAQGNLDGFSIVNGHEYAETVTDAVPGAGWVNNTGSSSNGEENGDECAWISSGAQAATQNVSMSTGYFAMQSTWSNDTNACNISHAIVGAPSATELVSVQSGRCLDDPASSLTLGTKMEIWDCHGGANQKFTYTSSGALQFLGQCLDDPAGSKTPGTRVELWSCNGGANQHWTFNANNSITLQGTNLCLDVTGANTANGTPVELWTCNGGTNQQWIKR